LAHSFAAHHSRAATGGSTHAVFSINETDHIVQSVVSRLTNDLATVLSPKNIHNS
jgi:hypothetical protein